MPNDVNCTLVKGRGGEGGGLGEGLAVYEHKRSWPKK